MPLLRYTTPHGITVSRSGSKVPYRRGLDHILRRLDDERGVYLSSGYEYPERYSRWDVASTAPPIEIIGQNRSIEIRPCNERGKILLGILDPLLETNPDWDRTGEGLLRLKPLSTHFAEEERS